MQEQSFNPEPDPTVQQTCTVLNCTPPTVYKMLRDGKLQGYVVGSRGRRITRESIERLRKGKAAA